MFAARSTNSRSLGTEWCVSSPNVVHLALRSRFSSIMAIGLNKCAVHDQRDFWDYRCPDLKAPPWQTAFEAQAEGQRDT
jgi:hypothetical protein